MDYSFKNIILFLTERFLKNYSIYKKKNYFMIIKYLKPFQKNKFK